MKINIEVSNLDELKELCAQLTGGIVVAETTPAPKEEKKKATKAKAKKAKAKKATTPGTDSTQDTEQSKPGAAQDSTEEEVETSATADLHPDVSRDEVRNLVKKAMTGGHTDKVKLALHRLNVARVAEVPEDKLGVFYTDLEALLGGD